MPAGSCQPKASHDAGHRAPFQTHTIKCKHRAQKCTSYLVPTCAASSISRPMAATRCALTASYASTAHLPAQGGGQRSAVQALGDDCQRRWQRCRPAAAAAAAAAVAEKRWQFLNHNFCLRPIWHHATSALPPTSFPRCHPSSAPPRVLAAASSSVGLMSMLIFSPAKSCRRGQWQGEGVAAAIVKNAGARQTPGSG